ncbi:hypothetical protein SAMN02745857_03053 [Andreprevotia lacus DSM 23236]|jgi:hypothetical protein|uniref:Small metal-binding protein n=1 Tax=Andreprevotia lacus DSM 23236 TaxID=1121001 RepID=A0A1W1XVL0_9NEIS|nr:hypothetical protein [Andreprevotia lacus]SMC27956.1 hypothetical protein SAMN02745857_03053 [Andreprevotia lacus DSM 23236]
MRKFLVLPAIALLASLAAHADNPGDHPYYLHALTDLRDARAHLEHLDSDRVDHAEEKAIAEIDAAIGEIKHAAIDDGKDIHAHEPVDAHLKRTDRFHKALELLGKASQDVGHEEDQSSTKGLQKRALKHIEAAKRETHRVIETVLKSE